MKPLIGRLIMVSLIAVVGAGCGDKGTTYSMLSTGQSFKQSKVNSKIDMLWVIDNSGSMQPLQNNMTSNFNSFMSQFVTKGYDYHLSVTSTDSFLANSGFNNNPNLARFRDGAGSNHSGVFTIVPTTLNLIQTFVTNAKLGTNGSGDERAFSSFREALNSPLNTGFLRDDSFFAMIILSDEDDFSDMTRREYSWTYQGGKADQSYSNPTLETVDSYVDYLDDLTHTTGAFRRYSVSAITVLDSACVNQHRQASPSTLIGQRYISLANKTDGVLGSVCTASYAPTLDAIQSRILELGTQFYLNVKPVEASIRVAVNGVSVPNDLANGWTYNSAANSIVFHGGAIPPAGADISVLFDPETLEF